MKACRPRVTATDPQVGMHRNDVVEFRSTAARRASAALRRSALYPRLRSAVGASRLRQFRGAFTRRPALPSLEEALASCNERQRRELRDLQVRAGAPVHEYLTEQDHRHGLDWCNRSSAARRPVHNT